MIGTTAAILNPKQQNNFVQSKAHLTQKILIIITDNWQKLVIIGIQYKIFVPVFLSVSVW